MSRWVWSKGERCAQEGASLRTPFHRAAWLGIAALAGVGLPVLLVHHGNDPAAPRAAAAPAAQASVSRTAPATARTEPLTTTMAVIQDTVATVRTTTEAAIARARRSAYRVTASKITGTVDIGHALTMTSLQPAPPDTAPAPAPTPVPAPSTDVPGDSPVRAEPQEPPPGPLAIQSLHVTGVGSNWARISWKTTIPAHSLAAYGSGGEPAAFTATTDGAAHEAVLTGLDFSSGYQVWVHALDDWDRTSTASVTLNTSGLPNRTSARAQGDTIVLDDQPFFPIAVWAQCSDGFGRNIDDGINLFMGNGCGSDSKLAGGLGGRAYSIVDGADSEGSGRGVIGTYYPDEWDAFVPGNVTRAQLRPHIQDPRAGRISFLTLTNHFYSLAEPLPSGKGMYPTLMSIPDVVGFDLYPLQVWCRSNAFGDVLDAQHELHTLSGGKPTFQWIEVAPMEHNCPSAYAPTPATVRAEAWLSVAGGADAIGYFPNNWTNTIGAEVTRTNAQINALSPALLSPAGTATSDNPVVRVSTRMMNGALYVIAVNTSRTATVQATVTAAGLAGRALGAYGEGRKVDASGDTFKDSFGPLAARVYVAAPSGW